MTTDVDRATDPIPEAGQAPTFRERIELARARLAAPAPAVRSVDLAGFRHVTEREPGPWICCAPCSGAMVTAWLGASPATLEAAHLIRTKAGKRHVGGMSPDELASGVLRAYGIELEAVPRDGRAISERLRAGWAIAVPMTYGRLPTHLRRWSPTFTGGHMGVLAGIDDTGHWGWWDPVAPAGWRGEYVLQAPIMGALWQTGLQGAPRREARDVAINAVPFTTGVVVDLARGAGLYDRADLAGEPRLELAGATAVTYVGIVSAEAIAVHVPTGPERYAVLYAHRGPTPRRLADPAAAARLEGRRLEWQRWRDAIAPIDEPS